MTESRGLQGNSKRSKSAETWKVGAARPQHNRSRLKNDQLRGRKHITPDELKTICGTIKQRSRHPDRDELMTLMAFHHGLRVGELVALQWQHINLKNRQVKVTRLKNGIPSTHPITSRREITLLNRLHKAAGKPKTGFLFNTERGTPVSANGFQKLFSAASEQALGIKWNVHALRHGCGTELVEQGQHLHTIKEYMGHVNIANTALYLHDSAKRFQGIQWD
nr:tyrosine-type recombinase/integrase [Microbulbifer sp.]